jgi:hypothetical protein
MPPELSSQPARPEDQPLDAVVFDAYGPPADGAAAYPYGPPGVKPFQVRPKDIYRPPPLLNFDLTEVPAEYVVPKRFGMSAILGITTAIALLFGCLRFLQAEPGWYLFFGVQTIIICLVQMFHGKAPRKASAIAGAIIAPLFLMGTAWFGWQDTPAEAVLCVMVMMVPCGAFAGYLHGTCAAGIFLVMDKLEKALQGQQPVVAPANTSPPASAT